MAQLLYSIVTDDPSLPFSPGDAENVNVIRVQWYKIDTLGMLVLILKSFYK